MKFQHITTKLTGIILSLFVFAVAGCTTSDLRWKNTENISYTESVPEGRSSVVVYRQDGAIEGSTVNVYINGEYLASLQPNAYKQELVCSQNQRLHAEFTNDDRAYLKKEKLGNYYNLPDARVAYFKIVNQNNHPAIQSVPAEQAQKELKNMPRQSHTLSRVEHKEDCSVVLKEYTLETATLFKFDRADYVGMLPKGKQELQAVAKEIKENTDHVEQIQVVGYTDPQGKAAYNQRLSELRAKTVKQALVAGGINASLIKAEGRGEEELLIDNCHELHSKDFKALQVCNQPNRRVTITVRGKKQ